MAGRLLVSNFWDLRLSPFGYPTTTQPTYSDFISYHKTLHSLPSPLLVLICSSLLVYPKYHLLGGLLSTEVSQSTAHHCIFPLVSAGEPKLGHVRQVLHQ